MEIDWVAIVMIVCITVLFILFAGTPDLMDGIIAYLQK